jgi:hypothetical protein
MNRVFDSDDVVEFAKRARNAGIIFDEVSKTLRCQHLRAYYPHPEFTRTRHCPDCGLWGEF